MKRAAIAAALTCSVALAGIPTTAAVAATPQAAPSASTSQASPEWMRLRASKTSVYRFGRVDFAVRSTMTGRGVLYQNGRRAPNIRAISLRAGKVSRFYYMPGVSGRYFVRIGNSLQSNVVVVTIR